MTGQAVHLLGSGRVSGVGVGRGPVVGVTVGMAVARGTGLGVAVVGACRSRRGASVRVAATAEAMAVFWGSVVTAEAETGAQAEEEEEEEDCEEQAFTLTL